MNLIGCAIMAVSIFLQFYGYMLIGAILLAVGGSIAYKLFLSCRGIGFCLIIVTSFYAYHNAFSVFVFWLLFIGIFLLLIKKKDSSGWGVAANELWEGSSDVGGSDGGGGGD